MVVCLFSSLDATVSSRFFFFHVPSTTELYTLSLHDALPIFSVFGALCLAVLLDGCRRSRRFYEIVYFRSEEHTSELQSRPHLVCRLLLEKKNRTNYLRTLRSTTQQRERFPASRIRPLSVSTH